MHIFLDALVELDHQLIFLEVITALTVSRAEVNLLLSGQICCYILGNKSVNYIRIVFPCSIYESSLNRWKPKSHRLSTKIATTHSIKLNRDVENFIFFKHRLVCLFVFRIELHYNLYAGTIFGAWVVCSLICRIFFRVIAICFKNYLRRWCNIRIFFQRRTIFFSHIIVEKVSL